MYKKGDKVWIHNRINGQEMKIPGVVEMADEKRTMVQLSMDEMMIVYGKAQRTISKREQ